MLALLSLVVPRDIHRMNAVKILLGALAWPKLAADCKRQALGK